MIPTLLILATAMAEAPAPGYFHPDSIAASSSTFARYAEALQPRFDEGQNGLARAGQGVADMEIAVLLLGDRAPASLQEHFAQQRANATHGYLQLQAHVSLLEEDSSATFGDAMQRAIDEQGGRYTLTQCAGATGIAAMTGPGRGVSGCEGENLNGAIAAAMDKDAVLQANVDEILGLDWPALKVADGPMAPVPFTGEAEVVQLSTLAKALVQDQMDTLAAQLEQELRPHEVDMEEGDAAAMKASQEARKRYEEGMAALGAQLMVAIEKPLTKKKRAVALCANPPLLGGCTGADVTSELVGSLSDNKKVLKALR